MIEERVASPIVNTEPTELQVSEDTVVVGGGVVETADPIINTPATDNVVDIISVKEVKDLIEDKVGDDIRVPGNVEVGGELKVDHIFPNNGTDVYIGSSAKPKKLWLTGGAGVSQALTSYQLIVAGGNGIGFSGNNAKLGNAISQADYLDSTTIHAGGTISEFECFKIGQLIYVVFKYNTASHGAGDTIFNIKTPYRIKNTLLITAASGDGGVSVSQIHTSGNISLFKNITSSTNVYIHALYQIA